MLHLPGRELDVQFIVETSKLLIIVGAALVYWRKLQTVGQEKEEETGQGVECLARGSTTCLTCLMPYVQVPAPGWGSYFRYPEIILCACVYVCCVCVLST